MPREGRLEPPSARHDGASTGRGRSRGSARARGGLDMYKGVSVCVVLWPLCVGVENVLAEKKTAKKEACVSRVLVVAVSKGAYASALGQTYVRQSLPVVPGVNAPHLAIGVQP